MRVLGTTLCGKWCMGLQHVGPAIHNTFACLLGVDVPQEELPQKDSVVQFNIEFLLCWWYAIAHKLAYSQVHNPSEHGSRVLTNHAIAEHQHCP
jgi:hypothetical protein